MIPPDVVLSFSYIRGLLSIVLFSWFGSSFRRGFFLFFRLVFLLACFGFLLVVCFHIRFLPAVEEQYPAGHADHKAEHEPCVHVVHKLAKYRSDSHADDDGKAQPLCSAVLLRRLVVLFNGVPFIMYIVLCLFNYVYYIL